MAKAKAKKMSVPSTLSDVLEVQRQILADAEARGFGESARFAIRLALDEALSNAVHHGNKGDTSKQVHVEYSVSDEEVAISIADDGPGFNPACVPDPTLDENLERPHGRGVMLMKAYMTGVSFNKKGNRVTLVKTRACTLPHA